MCPLLVIIVLLLLITIIGDTQSAEFSHIRPLFNFVFFHIPSVDIRTHMCSLLLIITTRDTRVSPVVIINNRGEKPSFCFNACPWPCSGGMRSPSSTQ